MNQGKKFERVLGIVAGIVIIWLLIVNQDKKKKIVALEEELKSNEELTDQIKKSLQELISSNPEIDSDIANELAQIAALIEIKQETKAILGLAKIIENLLKELYKDNPELKEFAKERKRNKANFDDYLEFALKKGSISKEDYHLIAVLKIIRNQEAHELDVKKEKGRLVACFIAGLSITFGLYKLVRAAVVKKDNK